MSMDDYKEVTSSLEGRLYLRSGKNRPRRDDPEAYFQPRPETHAVVNSWLSLRANNAAVKSATDTGYYGKEHISDKRSIHGITQQPESGLPLSSSSPVGNEAFTVTLELAEPVLYLEGFDESHSRAHRSTVLRGILHLHIFQQTSLRELSLAFRGSSKTVWPESWRLRKLKRVFEEDVLQCSWDFLQDSSNHKHNKLSSTKRFKPGLYTAHFELPLDSSLPETIFLPLGAVSYMLTATAVSDTQSKSAKSMQEITLIRIPCACSLELVEPFGVHGSQHGLRYSFGLFAKSVAIGGQVPISMRLASPSDISWQRITVSVVEEVQYQTRDGLAQREQSKTKAILLEKRANVMQEPAGRRALRRMSTAGEKMAASYAAAVHVQKPLRRGSHSSSSQAEVNLLEKAMLRMPTCSVLQPDTAYSCIYVHHYLVITVLARMDMDETTYRNFEVQIKLPMQILTCKLSLGNTLLPRYSERPGHQDLSSGDPPLCRCRSLTQRFSNDGASDLERRDSNFDRWSTSRTIRSMRQSLPPYYDLPP